LLRTFNKIRPRKFSDRETINLDMHFARALKLLGFVKVAIRIATEKAAMIV
jgi:hypothetical protein